jgi:hypothetical protein
MSPSMEYRHDILTTARHSAKVASTADIEDNKVQLNLKSAVGSLPNLRSFNQKQTNSFLK